MMISACLGVSGLGRWHSTGGQRKRLAAAPVFLYALVFVLVEIAYISFE